MANLTFTTASSCVNREGRITVQVYSVYVTVRVYLRAIPEITEDGETPAYEYYQDLPGGNGTATFSNLPDAAWRVTIDPMNGDAVYGPRTITTTCAITPPAPIPCTLEIESVSIEGTTVTATVTGANGPTEYSLDAFATVQDSNVFEGVGHGVHFVYARDKEYPMCVATQIFRLQRSYGLLYTHSFEAAFIGPVTLNIYEREYTGEVIPLNCLGGEAVNITMNGQDDDRFKVLKPTECNITLRSVENFEYMRLYSADERKHKVEMVQGETILWQGFLLPQFYQQPYLSGPYNVALTATDGLADLKYLEFRPRHATLFPAPITILEALRFCLYSIDSDLPLYLGVNYYSDAMDPDTDPMAQASILPTFSVEKDKILDCYEVLERLLKPFGRLFQQYGGWHLYDPDRMGEEFTRRRYTLDGVLLGAEPYKPTVQVLSPTEGYPHFINNSQFLTLAPVYAEQAVAFEYGEIHNLAKYGDWPKGSLSISDGKPKEWLVMANTVPTVSGLLPEVGKKLVVDTAPVGRFPTEFWNYVQSPPYAFERSAAITVDRPLRVRLKFSVSAFNPDAELPGNEAEYGLFYEVKVGSYYATGGTWTTTLQQIRYGGEVSGKGMEHAFYFPQPPVDGPLTIRLYAPKNIAGHAYQLGPIVFDYVKVEYGNFREFYSDFSNEELVGDTGIETVQKGEPVQLRIGDTKPGLYANSLLVDGVNTLGWTDPDGYQETIQVHFLNKLLRYVSRPHLKLDCDLLGPLAFDAVISEEGMPEKSFLPNYVSWDVVRGMWNCQYLELRDVPVITDGFDYEFDFEMPGGEVEQFDYEFDFNLG